MRWRRIGPAARDVERDLFRLKAKFSGLGMSDTKRLRALEEENARLKLLLADTMLDNPALSLLKGQD